MRTAQMRKEGRTRSADAQPPVFLLQLLGWTARDVVGFAVGALATVAIAINVLFMQSGSHPAPFFKPAATASKALSVEPKPISAASARRIEPIMPPAGSKATPPAMRAGGEIITDIQRELSRRGYYEGPLDGLYGPKTDAAIRDFEHALGLKPSTQPNDSLLQTISRPPAARPDTSLDPPAASPRIIAVQRALAEFGYGQIRANGIVDAETQRAIERFERERKLPITGQISDRVIRELTAATGRPLE